MAVEIERKFLVTSDAWRAGAKRKRYVQGYLQNTEACVVRVRVAGDDAFLTIKGKAKGIARAEYEYAIPVADADAMLKDLATGGIVEKVRHLVHHGAHTWEVDEFTGDNAGLVVAEIELSREDETFERPEWLGDDVTDDPRYLNASLSQRPFKEWQR
jgi:adenylate cyclase